MHRVPSSYYNFRDSLGKHNRLREDLEIALTSEDIWADFENALGTLNLELMGGRDIIDMWLDNFGFFSSFHFKFSACSCNLACSSCHFLLQIRQ